MRLSQLLLAEASRSLVVAGLEPGRFVELPGRDGVIYVGGMSADGTSRIESIERIDLATDTAANTLTIAAKDINEFETLSEENLVSDEGYGQFRGCIATRSFTRGSIIKAEEIACLSSR